MSLSRKETCFLRERRQVMPHSRTRPSAVCSMGERKDIGSLFPHLTGVCAWAPGWGSRLEMSRHLFKCGESWSPTLYWFFSQLCFTTQDATQGPLHGVLNVLKGWRPSQHLSPELRLPITQLKRVGAQWLPCLVEMSKQVWGQ